MYLLLTLKAGHRFFLRYKTIKVPDFNRTIEHCKSACALFFFTQICPSRGQQDWLGWKQ